MLLYTLKKRSPSIYFVPSYIQAPHSQCLAILQFWTYLWCSVEKQVEYFFGSRVQWSEFPAITFKADEIKAAPHLFTTCLLLRILIFSSKYVTQYVKKIYSLFSKNTYVLSTLITISISTLIKKRRSILCCAPIPYAIAQGQYAAFSQTRFIDCSSIVKLVKFTLVSHRMNVSHPLFFLLSSKYFFIFLGTLRREGSPKLTLEISQHSYN